MLALVPSTILLLAGDSPGLWTRLEPYLDYPGFEAWKFVNLAVFVGVLVYVLTRKVKLGEAFKARREGIKNELARAQRERDAAVAKLKEVEQRLARLDAEVAEIQARSKKEAADERKRISHSTETEIAKLSEQAQREIESAGKVARHELRRYSAEQSVRLAEEMIRREIRPDDDARLIDSNIRELGGSTQ